MRFDEILRAHAFMQTERLVLGVSNVTVEEDDDEEAWVAPGDYVAVTVRGPGRLADDVVARRRGSHPRAPDQCWPRADEAGAVYAYTRDLGDGGAVTVFLPSRADE